MGQEDLKELDLWLKKNAKQLPDVVKNMVAHYKFLLQVLGADNQQWRTMVIELRRALGIMTKSEKELFQLTKLSCYIALDNFKEIEILIGKLKYKNFKAIKIYETILHSYLFCGFPAAIESLKIFKKYYKHYKSIPNEVSNQNLKKSVKINL